MEIPRITETQIVKKIGKQKVILLYGTRRTGKSTIVENIAAKDEKNSLLLQGEDMEVARLLQNRSVSNYKRLADGKKLIIIDEAKTIPEIGKILKLMIDTIKGITIIATGSSRFDLQNSTGEPLVGRNIGYQLFPIAQMEFITDSKSSDNYSGFRGKIDLWKLS